MKYALSTACEMTEPQNLIDVDTLVAQFLDQHSQGIATIHRIYFQNNDMLSICALVAELMDKLRTECATFLNRDLPIEELNPYLFYIVNAHCKEKAASSNPKKKTEYLCPGCLFRGKYNLIVPVNNFFRCDNCEDELKKATDPKKIAFYRTFFRHNKAGYRCGDCNRFIPHPTDESPIVTCPYYDCIFVGQRSLLRRMHHPTLESNAKILTLDANLDGRASSKNNVQDQSIDTLAQLEPKEDLDHKIKILREVIDNQTNMVPYNSSDFTIKHKCLSYQAFSNLLKKYPSEMVEYLLKDSRSGGFQHKVFQEYVKLLEEALPFYFKKNNKQFKVTSLLDPNLNLFDGISSFDATVNEKLCVKNNTQEFYIGGRKATVTKPFFIGKILNVVDKNTKAILIDNVVEYSFLKIKFRDIVPGTEVIVTHLRAPPHYQMGGMVYVNRIRKKIVDCAKVLLDKQDHD